MDAQIVVVLKVIKQVSDFRSKGIPTRACAASGSLSESESSIDHLFKVDPDSEPDTDTVDSTVSLVVSATYLSRRSDFKRVSRKV